MAPNLTIDSKEFSAAIRQYSIASKRELSKELNRRMFYILLRAYVLIAPRSLSAAKARARAYLEAIVPKLLPSGAKSRTKSKVLRRIHLIAQGGLKKSGMRVLLPREIKEQSATPKSGLNKRLGAIRRSAISGQGYVKSSVVKVLNKLSRTNLGVSFSQYGRGAVVRKSGRVSRPEQPPNAALVKIAAEYGVGGSGQIDNVGVFKSTEGTLIPARPGINPTVSFKASGKTDPKSQGKVNAILASAMQRAIADETEQLKAKLAEKLQQVANKFNAA